MAEIHDFVRVLWDTRNWTSMTIVELNSVFLKFMRRAVEENVDPQRVENAFYDVDSTLTSTELVSAIEEAAQISYGAPEEELAEFTLSEIDSFLAQFDERRVSEADYEKVLAYEEAVRRRREERKEFQSELEKFEREKAELEQEYQRRLREAERRAREVEARKVKMVTVRFLNDMPQFIGVDLNSYGPYKTGETASLPEGNVATLIDGGAAEIWRVPAAPPAAPPEIPKVWVPKPKILPPLPEVCPIDSTVLEQVERVPLFIRDPLLLTSEEEYWRTSTGLPLPSVELQWIDVPVTMQVWMCRRAEDPHYFERDTAGRLVQRTGEFLYRKILRETAKLRRIMYPIQVPGWEEWRRGMVVVRREFPFPHVIRLEEWVERVKGMTMEQFDSLPIEEMNRLIKEYQAYIEEH